MHTPFERTQSRIVPGVVLHFVDTLTVPVRHDGDARSNDLRPCSGNSKEAGAVKRLHEPAKVGSRNSIMMGSGHRASGHAGEPDVPAARQLEFEASAAFAPILTQPIRELYIARVNGAR